MTKYDVILKKLCHEEDILNAQLISEDDFLTGVKKGILKYKPVSKLAKTANDFSVSENMAMYLFTDESIRAFKVLVRKNNSPIDRKINKIYELQKELRDVREVLVPDEAIAAIEKKLVKILT